MNTRPPDDGRRPLPLPDLESPRELDQRILARARAGAPQRRGGHSLAWGGGIATAAVLVVAVYLTTLNEQQIPAPPPPADAPVQAEATLKKEQHIGPASVRMARSRPAAPAIPDSVTAALQRLRELVDRGEDTQARREYAELRNSCSDCGLPEKLEEALATLAPEE